MERRVGFAEIGYHAAAGPDGTIHWNMEAPS